MKSTAVERRRGLIRLKCVAVLLIATMSAAAQSVPASIVTIDQPTSGQAVFDAAGNVYYLSTLTTQGAAQTQPGGGTCYFNTGYIGPVPEPCSDAGVAKVDSAGNLVWGTLLGGPTADDGAALAVDSAGNVVLTGYTGGQFPTTAGAAIPSFTPTSSTSSSGFAAKISADGTKFLYSTYLPTGEAQPIAIAVDAQSNAYIAGHTNTGHAFVMKLSADGSIILYNVVFAGSSGEDAAVAIAIDAAGDAVVAGETASPDFPVTAGALQATLRGTENNFIVRLDPAGNLLMSTYLGGTGIDSPAALALDGAGNIDLAGATSSFDFPATPGTMQPTPILPAWNNNSPAGFVAQVAGDGSKLNWASYVMSSDLGSVPGYAFPVGVQELAATVAGDLYIGGLTGPGFPVTASATQICFGGTASSTNGFVGHLSARGALLDATYVGPGRDVNVDYVWGLMPRGDGQVAVVWHDSGTNFLSNLQFGGGGWSAAPCLSTDVLNAATQSGNYGIAPAELVTLTGFGIGPETGAVYQPDSQGNVPTQVGGVQIAFDGVAAPVLYAQSRQINAIVPSGVSVGGTTKVTVTYNCQQFGPVTAPITFGSPGIFRLQAGLSSQAVAMNQDGTWNGPQNPAPRGSVVAVWATGFGETDPPCPVGGLNDASAEPLASGTEAVIVGPTIISPQYTGSAPTLVCGVVQINFQAPTNIEPGTYHFWPWVESVNGNTTTELQSPLGATIVVK